MHGRVEVGGGGAGLSRRTERESSHQPSRQTLAIRCGAGLGDAIYLHSVALHLVKKGFNVEACSDYPDVFRTLAPAVSASPFRRERIDRIAHYSMRRDKDGTTQFQDCCIQAGINEPVDLQINWNTTNRDLEQYIWAKAGKRPIICVQLPRAPFNRKDGFGAEFLPDCSVIQRAIDRIKDRAFLIQIGAGEALYKFDGIELDLTNKTSVCELIDVGSMADGFLGYCSFIVPLSESFDTPSLLVWSRRGLSSPQPVVRRMTPQKILHKKSSRYVIDNCSEKELAQAADAFLEQARSSGQI